MLAVRVHDRHGDYIIDRLREMRPDIYVSKDKLPVGDRPKALICFRPPTDEPLDQYAWIHCTGAGLDHIEARLSTDAPPPRITRTLGSMGRQFFEFCLSYLLADLQRHQARSVRAKTHLWDPETVAPNFLFDRSVLVVGQGGLGSEISLRMSALAHQVYSLSRSGRQFSDNVVSVRSVGDIERPDRIFAVIGVLPNTDATHNFFDREFFGRLSNCIFINIGRGQTVDDDALLDALADGTVKRAVLDVFREEPLPNDHWAWAHPAIDVTPHISALTRPEDAVDAFLKALSAQSVT